MIVLRFNLYLMEPGEYYNYHYPGHLMEFLEHAHVHEHLGERGVYVPVDVLKPENLRYIPDENKPFFFYALAFNFLLDQAMSVHFKEDYPAFREATLFPKVESRMTDILVEPWDVAGRAVNFALFESFAKFYAGWIRDFLESKKFSKANWEAVRAAMLGDPDIASGHYGEIFINVLKVS